MTWVDMGLAPFPNTLMEEDERAHALQL